MVNQIIKLPENKQTIKKAHVNLVYCLLLTTSNVWCQTEIPLNTWRMHLSFNTIIAAASSQNQAFGASENAIMILEKSDYSISSYSKLNGLTTTGITDIAYNEPKDQLIVAYADGNLDIITGNRIINFNRLKNSNAVNGSKTINHILIQSDYAYLSTDFGLVVFDLIRLEVKETWRDLGANGATLKIVQSTFQGDSIFLATERGVIVGNINDNLLDYNYWKRFDQGIFNTTISSIAYFNNRVYAAINNVGIYSYATGIWTLEGFLQNLSFTSISASVSDLLIVENNHIWKLGATNILGSISSDFIKQPCFASQDKQGNLWIADKESGLVSNVSGSFTSYLPNGPKNSKSFRLKYDNNSIFNLSGGYSKNFTSLGLKGDFDVFKDGTWSTQASSINDLTDIDFPANGTNYFISSFGYGLESHTNGNGNDLLYNDTNSPLINLNPPGKFVNIPAIENSTAGLWVANYGTANSLHLLKIDNTWESFSFPNYSASRYPTELLVDYNGYVWMILNPLQGGGLLVFDRAHNLTKYLTDKPGVGALPSKSVHSIALDRDGYVWVGTDSGVAYFIDTDNIFTTPVDAVKPIFEFRYLLKNENITTITVDAANRKWIGTDKGAWLFNPTGEKQIYNFTIENSPLLSNAIRDVEINPISGEVFFATENGVVSFRGDATQSNSSFNTVKIFPNPVTHQFSGTVGISGLSTDATVKITDVSGNLVWQTIANGGTATWNVQDYNGRRASTGIYIVFATSSDGAENAVGKIAIID